MYSFLSFEPVHFHVNQSGSNCSSLTCIQISQEIGKVIWCSHLLKYFPQFVVIHTVISFSIVNEAEVFLELSCFFYDPMDVGNLISGSNLLVMIQWMLVIWSLVPLPFLNTAWTSGSPQFMYCWSLAWRILSITLLVCEMSAIVWYLEHHLALPFFESRMKTDLFQSCVPNLLVYWV